MRNVVKCQRLRLLLCFRIHKVSENLRVSMYRTKPLGTSWRFACKETVHIGPWLLHVFYLHVQNYKTFLKQQNNIVRKH